MVFLALRIGHAQDQHVFCQPALVTAHVGGNAQSQALLAQQGIAAVAGAIGPDLARFRVVDDVLDRGVAGPGRSVLLSFGQGGAHRVHARYELAVGAEHVMHRLAHSGHQLLVDHHVGTVGQFHADVRNVRAQRAHAEWHHVHRAALHAAVEQRLKGGAHVHRGHPVVGRAGIFLPGRTDIGAVFHAGHIRRVGQGQVAARPLGGVELLEGTGIHQLLAHAVVFVLAAVAPVNGVGLAQSRHVGNPGNQLAVLDVRGGIQVQALHGG
ncbi:MAG: hypothetical protein BWX79_01343 [Alphaproteobacteria bacterium ADurb.Bin100]|nr:MAG: hypothetical protein BWX79_01343 [Alphaproteobacteria bacterium ADurb.Bin100]